MLADGMVIAATDYPGLGSPGMHPYLVGVSEGRSVLDSVRAARQIAATGASDRFIPFGYSQGGHAALFAGQLAAGYAPELKLEGVAAGAPPADLYDLFKAHVTGKGNRILGAFIVASWSQVYHLPLDQVIDRGTIPALHLAARACIGKKWDVIPAALNSVLLGHRFLNERLYTVAAWKSRLEQNSPGLAPAVPYFVGFGTADEIVPPAETKALAKSVCSKGHRLLLRTIPGKSHGAAAEPAAVLAAAWMDARFKGATAPDGCGTM